MSVGGLTHSLQEAVRKIAFKTSVDKLKKRGVKSVNVLGLDRIVSLIEEATSRSLRHRLLAGDRAAIANATKEEFLRLLRNNQELKKSRQDLEAEKESAVEDATTLRNELLELTRQLKDRLRSAGEQAQSRYQGEDSEILELIDILYRDSLQSGDLGQFKQRMIDLLFASLERERRVAVATTEAAKDKEVDLLQRRIAKLAERLRITEGQLTHISAAGPGDQGTASVYREVQGLDPNALFFEKKKELMDGIFKANLQLQKQQLD